jgi:uncharacterized protein YjbI with pentapeptide repeats
MLHRAVRKDIGNEVQFGRKVPGRHDGEWATSRNAHVGTSRSRNYQRNDHDFGNSLLKFSFQRFSFELFAFEQISLEQLPFARFSSQQFFGIGMSDLQNSHLNTCHLNNCDLSRTHSSDLDLNHSLLNDCCRRKSMVNK